MTKIHQSLCDRQAMRNFAGCLFPMRKKMICRRILLRKIVQIVFGVTILCFIHRLSTSKSNLKDVAVVSKRTTAPPKIILYWNNFFNFGPPSGSTLQCHQGKTECVFTSDKNHFNQSSVVLFVADYLNVDLPKSRSSPRQNFVFYEMEPPAISDSNGMFYDYKPERYVNFFNRTMTYRLDSDIVLLEPHGRTVKRSGSYSNIAEWKRKTKLVAWFVSNCETTIRREEYVRQLSQFIPVDVYGDCGNLTCGDKKSNGCFEMLRKDYKFSLAFENSWCQDYVTEKLYKPLYYDTVPVVMGGVDYQRFAPPNSFINVANYESPQKLAEYLMLLNESDDLYGRYFDWKKEYEIELNPMDGWCDLCQLAHTRNLEPKSYADIYKWWMGDDDCLKRDYTSLLT